MSVKMTSVFNVTHIPFTRSHVSHMRVDRLRRHSAYVNPKSTFISFGPLLLLLSSWFLRCSPFYGFEPTAASVNSNGARLSNISTCFIHLQGQHDSHGHLRSDSDSNAEFEGSGSAPPWVNFQHLSDIFGDLLGCYAPAIRLRGGQGSDSEHSDEDFDSDSPSPSKKRKIDITAKKQATKRKGKGKAKADPALVDPGIRVTLAGRNGAPGMFVDEVLNLYEAPELWDIPQHHRVAYILDLSTTPECLQLAKKTMTVDGHAKKQCQDAWDGGTGSKKKGLAKVTILDEGAVIECRRSNLTCNGFYSCSLAAPDHLAGFERWDSSGSATKDLISDPSRAAKIAEANDVVAIATAFYRSVMKQRCKAEYPNQHACDGHAVLRKFQTGNSNGKAYFVGCSNWIDGDGLKHRFTHVRPEVRESILYRLFRNEEIDVEDAEIVEGDCLQIVHPSNITANKRCPRVHYRNSKLVAGTLTRQHCPAELLILIPIDETDPRAVVIPKSGIAHNHPPFPRSKVPFAAAQKYRSAIDAVGLIGTTTLRVDRAPSTQTILGGLLPEELHPSLINKRKHRDMVHDARTERFPEGMGIRAVWNEFENEKSRAINDRYIHMVTMQTDMHVIITINPELALLVHDASWIMVDTTFAVVHGTTNEWKLLIWLSGLDKRTVIGRVWTDRATREAFVLVWNGIFDAIQRITGKALNFQVFTRSSSLLGVIGDAEGAQAQGLGDVVILRGMNSSNVNGVPTVTVDSILLFIWKTCLVHFKRGVLALESHVDQFTFNVLLGNTKVKNWWAHKISYPWLLPSLNRCLTSMTNRNWDLTPGDTNPIEGSHAQDNQVNATNRTLLEAILLAREYDKNTARVIKASAESGILENGNNSLLSPATLLQLVAKLGAKLRAAEEQSRAKDLEIKRLKAMLSAAPSTPRRRRSAPSFESDRTPSNRVSPVAGPSRLPAPVAGPSRLPALTLFPDLPPRTPIADPPSDFDYQAAMRSDVLDATLWRIAQSPRDSDRIEYDPRGQPMYIVDSDDEIFASNPYPTAQ
ncbi:hypothetical protein B0H16DRAFT_1888450 [Mycena metata]|uniref:Uncharacterized protein n=1 Tax=Mycena metata TaxID=1033252 RepID=A0AAD7ISV2_9AGAR|nr:hypothetical protein B0H16DRAFT_1888450 [Mycena metata]